MTSCSQNYALLVPAKDVKTVKTLLESRGYLNKTRKIETYTGDMFTADQKHLLVPICPASSLEIKDVDEIHEAITQLLPDGQKHPLLTLSSPSTGPSCQPKKNPLHAAFSAALSQQLADSLLEPLSLSVPALVSALPTTYVVYSPLLLLPAHAFTAPEWQKLLHATAADGAVIQGVWAHVAQEMGVEAVAVNAAIPLGAAPPSPSPSSSSPSWNALRSPTGLTPLYGSFGPLPSPATSSKPSPADFAAALWVSTRQNGIAQTWAPLYTMFSRGNIREKARLLTLIPSLHNDLSTPAAPPPFAAADLYAGIGYFAFSYRRAGARPVLCWEMNPWSVEGLRRGAAANGWTTHVVVSDTTNENNVKPDQSEEEPVDADFIIFSHTNAAALADLAALQLQQRRRQMGTRGLLPPIRHVNGGLLPSSRGAWRTAVRAVDSKTGGWLHLHENFGAEEMESRTDQVVVEVRRLREEVWGERMGGMSGKGGEDAQGAGVELVHLEKVKTYAPGVWHVVLDLWVSPTDR